MPERRWSKITKRIQFVPWFVMALTILIKDAVRDRIKYGRVVPSQVRIEYVDGTVRTLTVKKREYENG